MSVKKIKVFLLSTIFLFSGLSSAVSIHSVQERKSVTMVVSIPNATYYRILKDVINKQFESRWSFNFYNYHASRDLTREITNSTKEKVIKEIKKYDPNILTSDGIYLSFQKFVTPHLPLESPQCSINQSGRDNQDISLDFETKVYTFWTPNHIAEKIEEIEACFSSLIQEKAPRIGEVEFIISVSYPVEVKRTVNKSLNNKKNPSANQIN